MRWFQINVNCRVGNMPSLRDSRFHCQQEIFKSFTDSPQTTYRRGLSSLFFHSLTFLESSTEGLHRISPTRFSSTGDPRLPPCYDADAGFLLRSAPVPKRDALLSWIPLLLVVALLTFRRIQDVDVWWHLQIGRDLLTHFDLPRFEDYYWSPISSMPVADLRYTWLGDVFLFLVHSLCPSFGLQVFVFILVMLACRWLWKRPGDRDDNLDLVILMGMVAGTYQLQIVRNAVFGLPLTAWFCAYVPGMLNGLPRHPWWPVPIMLGLWSCLHGSYLLGFGLLLLLVAGKLLECLRTQDEAWMPVLKRAALAVITSLVAISLFNPLTLETSRRLVKALWHFAHLLIPAVIVLSALTWMCRKRVKKTTWRRLVFGLVTAAFILSLGTHLKRFVLADGPILIRSLNRTVSADNLSLGERLKHGLNQVYWKADQTSLDSIDFLSPLDFPGDLYVWVTLCLGISCVFCLIRRRNADLSIWLPLAGLSILGLGYIRAVGYLAIFCAWVLIHARQLPNSAKAAPRSRWPVMACAWVLILASNVLTSWNFLGLYADHEPGFRKAGFLPVRAAGKILETWPKTPVFTTVENGGYLLFRWYPHKRVFMDGFFAPHTGKTMQVYDRARALKSVDPLEARFGMSLAVVGVRDPDWFPAFLDDPDWLPVLVDTGAVVFLRTGSIPNPITSPYLFDLSDLHHVEPYLTRGLARQVLNVAQVLLERGYLVSAFELTNSDDEVPRALRAHMFGASLATFDRNMAYMIERYGMQNHPLIPVEFAFFRALNAGRDREVLDHGLVLLESDPERPDLIRALAAAATRLGEMATAEEMGRRYQALQP